jgi:hypothetical protein
MMALVTLADLPELFLYYVNTSVDDSGMIKENR